MNIISILTFYQKIVGQLANPGDMALKCSL